MGVFAVSYLDLAALKADYDLEFNIGTLDEQNGKVASEIVIKNNSVVSTANVYVMPDGNYWTGPIHQTGPRSWMTGSEPLPESVKLKKMSVPNDMVQDFRDVDEILKYSLDVGAASTALDFVNGLKKTSGNDRAFMDAKYSHFSELWLARDNDGGCRFMFAFNMRSFIRSNSIFGNLLNRESEGVRAQIIDACKVRSVTVQRRRVKDVTTLNPLGSPATGNILFDKSEPYENIIMSGNDRNNRLKTRVTPTGTIRQSELTISRESDDYGIYYYTGQDKKMRLMTDGVYQYGVKIVVEDGSTDYLRSIAADLVSIRKDLDLYLEYASRLGMTKFLAEISDPHLDHESERRASVLESTGHYDPLRNRFTGRFYDFMENQYITVGAPFYNRRPWVDASSIYTSALATISSQAEKDITSSGVNIAEKINLFLSPTSGTPKGIMAVMGMLDNLILKYMSLTGDNYNSRTSATMDGSGTVQTSSVTTGENSPGNILETEYWFSDNFFDSNVKKISGLDYLTNFSNSGSNDVATKSQLRMARNEYANLAFGHKQNKGFKIIDGGTWVGRITAETEKYYTESDPNLDISHNSNPVTSGDSISNSSYGCLSTSYITSNDIVYSTGIDADPDYYMEIESGLLATNQNQAPTTPNTTSGTNQTDSQKLYQSGMESIWSNYNVTFESPMRREPIPLYLRGLYDVVQRTMCENQQLQAVDPYPGWTQDAAGNINVIGAIKDEEPVGEKNSNRTNVVAKISDALINAEVSFGSFVVSDGGSSSASESADAQEVMSSKDGTSAIMDKLQTDAQYASSIANSNGGTVDGSSSPTDVMVGLPNQLKAIFVAQQNPAAVKYPPTNDWIYSAKFNINHQFLALVHRFDGFAPNFSNPTAWANTGDKKWDRLFDAGEVGQLSVRLPRWVQLTEDFYLQSKGKEILCRLSPYVCAELGIGTKPGTLAPIFDTYFIITSFQMFPLFTQSIIN